MLCKKSLKANFFFHLSLLLTSLSISSMNYAQQLESETSNYTTTDTTAEKPVQYRRGISLQEGYQSYEEKYAGKNLYEEKRKLFPLQSTGVWTELNPKVPRVDYLGIGFVNKDTGWAVGDLGALIKTTDGGVSWTVSETNTTTPILKVRSFNGQIVLASGFDGLILRSTDGGETFTQVTSNVTGDLWGLQMINDTLGWACGNANSLIKTTDGGLSWQNLETPGYTSDYWWIDFMDESYGFIAANGKVLRTTDGGQNWEIIQAGDSYPLFSINVIDSLHIAAAGYGGTGYAAKNIYSSDGGYTWINGGQLTTEAVNCIQYVNQETGYLVMTDVSARKTTNRGQSWTIIGGIDDNYELQFLTQNGIGYSAGTILKLNKAEGNLDIWNRLILNDTFSDVYFTSESTGYITSRWLYKSMDGGINWIMSPNFPTNLFTSTLGSLTFTDSLTGLVGGPPCRIVKTTDAGENWYVANITGLVDTIGTINKIFFTDSATGWAVTSRGGILKTTDGGDNWFAQLNGALYEAFRSIFFSDSLIGWVLSPIYSTTNGGEHWIQRTDIQIYNGSDIYFINSTGFIINFQELNKTTDSGNNWFTQFNSQYVLRNFGWLSSNHGFVVGDGVYETNDSGDTWIEILELRNIGLRRFHSPKNYVGYATGNLGLIHKYVDTTIVPVELISFNAEVDNYIVSLNWSTATEVNNLGFEVLRSADDQYWDSIVFINGNGTTTLTNNYQFTDQIETSGIYYYKLKQIDYNGDFYYSDIIEVSVSNPFSFQLSQNFPNPANPTTTIKYDLPNTSDVTLVIYDILGRKVKELVNTKQQAGRYEVQFNASSLASGVFIYQLIADKFIQSRKMILLK